MMPGARRSERINRQSEYRPEQRPQMTGYKGTGNLSGLFYVMKATDQSELCKWNKALKKQEMEKKQCFEYGARS